MKQHSCLVSQLFIKLENMSTSGAFTSAIISCRLSVLNAKIFPRFTLHLWISLDWPMYVHYFSRFAIFVAVTDASHWLQHAVNHNDSMFVKIPFQVCFSILSLCNGCNSYILAPSRSLVAVGLAVIFMMSFPPLWSFLKGSLLYPDRMIPSVGPDSTGDQLSTSLPTSHLRILSCHAAYCRNVTCLSLHVCRHGL